ncbi:hypothetical protein UA08_06105 [Talaromyces atroroseus]|uniref:FAS1 domain-containing protein n=1 Tax=Talaromyces atroroseus TaxID=1441469 RepID=A0A225ASM9_TALAT|nr:hypothetical protein UA08_06105 [Talaromyces atroroseus]OKL58609.1 hypothetical protein UA08_06105 [Talaromyces atroroseus]
MKTLYNIQLAIYATVLSLTLVWLAIAAANTAALALRQWDLLPCAAHSYKKITTQQRLPPDFFGYIVGSQVEGEEEEEEEIAPSPQQVIMPPYAGGGGGDNTDDNNDNKNSNLIVSDMLVKTPKINVFASLTRDFHPVLDRLNDQSKNTTVLAPLNSAISALPRKPWEDPEDYRVYGEAGAYSGEEGQERAKRNLQRFVEAHLVPVSPWGEGEEVETVGGGKVRWVKEGDTVFVEPGHIEVDSLTSEVSNGNVWVLKGVINYQ